MKLSIIIPVYNSERTLQRLLNSILASTSQEFEVIIVNDGSTDGTLNLCEQIVSSDTRCKVYSKENGGVSAARNFGLDKAQGEYIFFCDGDDLVYTKILDFLLEKIGDIKTDCFVFDYMYNIEGKEIKKSSFKLTENQILSQEKVLEEILSPLILKVSTDMASLWHKAFLRNLIEENQIRFEEKVYKGEDWRFIVDYLSVAQTAYYVPEAIYEYYLDGSQTEHKYKRCPGGHLLGSVQRKLRINREKKLNASEDLLLKWYQAQVQEFLYCYKNGVRGKELKQMQADWSLRESVNGLLRAHKKAYFRNEISRKYKVYSFLIRYRLYWLIRV